MEKAIMEKEFRLVEVDGEAEAADMEEARLRLQCVAQAFGRCLLLQHLCGGAAIGDPATPTAPAKLDDRIAADVGVKTSVTVSKKACTSNALIIC
jgi:hypothetical protein